MKSTCLFFCLAFFILSGCQFPKTEAYYALNVRFNAPNLIFSDDYAHKLIITESGTSNVLTTFLLSGFSGSFTERFDLKGKEQFDRYDLHLVYQCLSDNPYVISYVNIPNGAPVFFEPSQARFARKRYVNIRNLFDAKHLDSPGRHQPLNKKVKNDHVALEIYAYPEENIILRVKQPQEKYLFIPKEAFINNVATVDYVNFSTWNTIKNVDLSQNQSLIGYLSVSQVSENGQSISNVLHSFSKDVSQPVNHSFALSENNVSFDQYLLEYASLNYQSNQLMSKNADIKLVVPASPLQSITLQNGTFKLYTDNSVDMARLNCLHKDVVYTVYGHPNDLQEYSIPELGISAKEPFTGQYQPTVQLFRSSLHGYHDMVNGFPFRDTNPTAKARSALEIFDLPF